MNLIQILLPVTDNEGRPFPASHFAEVRKLLTEKFGGMTAFTRAPAEGRWKEEEGSVARDDIVIFEVLVEDIDKAWWESYRKDLEALFHQYKILIRAQAVTIL